jgi:predicted lipoprotein with Yx(FWY)xxD motif
MPVVLRTAGISHNGSRTAPTQDFFMSHCKDTRMKHLFSVFALSTIALLTACGGGGGGGYGSTSTTPVNNTPASASSPTPFGTSGLVDTASVSSSSGTLSNVFVTTTDHHTIYIYNSDVGQAAPTCTAANSCLGFWPAVIASGTVSAPFGTVQNSGMTQLTYQGRPLYTFVDDTTAGVANGQGSTKGAATPFYAATASLSSMTTIPTY